MLEGFVHRFVHRDNHRASFYDSICTQCFRTVGTRPSESELAGDELQHTCSRKVLQRLAEKTRCTEAGVPPSCKG